MFASTPRNIFSLILALFSFIKIASAEDAASESAESSSPSTNVFRFEGGMNLYWGEQDKSLAGLRGYFASISRETEKGWLRTQLTFSYTHASGKVIFSDTTPTFNFFTLGMGAGFLVFPYETSGIAPFLGVSGFASRGSMTITNPPAGFPVYGRPLFYGYELSIGFDVQSRSHSLFRIRMGYATEIGSVKSAPLTSQCMRIALSI